MNTQQVRNGTVRTSKFIIWLGATIAVCTSISLFFFDLQASISQKARDQIRREIDMRCESIRNQITDVKRTVEHIDGKVDKIIDKISQK